MGMYACSWQRWPLKMKGLLLVSYVRGPWLLLCTAISCYSRIIWQSQFFKDLLHVPKTVKKPAHTASRWNYHLQFLEKVYTFQSPLIIHQSCPLFNNLLMTSQWYTVHSFTVQSPILYINGWQSLWWTVCFVRRVLRIPTAVPFLSLSLGCKWKIIPTTEWWADFRLKKYCVVKRGLTANVYLCHGE